MTSDRTPVLFVTVQYRNAADTEAFLKSIAELDDARTCEVIVVDNSPVEAKRASSLNLDRYQFPVQVVEAPTNLFYWGGAAFAIEALRRDRGRLPPRVIICNNDVTIPQGDFLRRLSEIDSEEFPIVAPAVISLATGRDQNPILSTPPGFLKRLKWNVYDLGYPLAKAMLSVHRTLVRNRSRSPSSGETQTPIYAAHGAFVILSSVFFERGGSLDTQVAMFAEELTLAETARALGLPIWHCPNLRVSHAEHSTTGSGLTREKYALERMARRRYYGLRRGSASGHETGNYSGLRDKL